MSQSILKRTVGGVDDKRLVLANGEALRNLTYLNNWNVVRLGMQVSIEAAALIPGTPQFVFGLSSGQTNGFGAPVSQHFLGMRSQGATAAYTAGPPAYWSFSTLKACKKIGGTITDAAAFTGTTVMIMPRASTTLVRAAVLLEITKGAPNFSIQMVSSINATAVGTDVTDTQFLNAMQSATMAGAAGALDVGGFYLQSNTVTLAIDEATNGFFDSFNVFWDRTAFPLEISAIRHRKLS